MVKKKKNTGNEDLYNLESGDIKMISIASGIKSTLIQDTLYGRSHKWKHIIDPIIKDLKKTKKRFYTRCQKRIKNKPSQGSIKWNTAQEV